MINALPAFVWNRQRLPESNLSDPRLWGTAFNTLLELLASSRKLPPAADGADASIFSLTSFSTFPPKVHGAGPSSSRKSNLSNSRFWGTTFNALDLLELLASPRKLPPAADGADASIFSLTSFPTFPPKVHGAGLSCDVDQTHIWVCRWEVDQRYYCERLAQLLQFCEGGKRIIELCACGVRHREYFEFDSVGGFAELISALMMGLGQQKKEERGLARRQSHGPVLAKRTCDPDTNEARTQSEHDKDGVRGGCGADKGDARGGCGADKGDVRVGSGNDKGNVRVGSGNDKGDVRVGSGDDKGDVRVGSGDDKGDVRVGSGNDKGDVRVGSGNDKGDPRVGFYTEKNIAHQARQDPG
ncbi:hypothetical protein B0H19DRAFT_1083047 [Mycena capillaripes]|nr:hypothetical protein B0H19DRAFT_1083047 [Mycena capillaripes]